MRAKVWGAMCLGAVLAWSAVASGQEAPSSDVTRRVEGLYLEGVALYKDNKFRAAIEKFQEAWELYPDPNLLYNIGRAYEALGSLEEARAHFVRCAESEGVPEELQAKALARVEAIKEAQEKSAAVTEPQVDQPQEPAKTTGPVTEGPPPASVEEGGGALGVIKWLSAATALGLVGTGGVFFALGAGDHADLDAAIQAGSSGVAPLTRVEAQRLAQDGEDRKTLGTILMGAGGGVAVLSVILFVLDGGEEGSAVNIQPQALEGGAVVTWGGRF